MNKDEFKVVDWFDFIGQEALKERLRTHIDGASLLGRALPHILLSGPPGFGKTTLAGLISDEMGCEFSSFNCPITERQLYNIVIGEFGQVVLLDEIHRLTKKDQETLLPILEAGIMYTSTGVEVEVENTLTIIAATTERDKIIAPLYDRFSIKPEFEPYSDDELREIVSLMAGTAGIPVDDTQALALGKAAGGIPRNAKHLLVALRDYRLSSGSEPTISQVLDLCQLDENGLTVLHLRYLDYLRHNGATGLATLSTILNIPTGAVVSMEQLLLRRGLMNYSKRGRELSGSGVRYGRENRDGS
jgi:holliday junction DNA helicase RuvB